MKKTTIWMLLLAAMMFFVSGCTRTIQGIQDDTCNAWYGTKHAIHNATAK
jgi:predicted small secreted protein